MRTLLVLGVLALTAFAGCLDDDNGSSTDGDQTTTLVGDYLVPAVPTVDAAALLADHAAFVTEHNERADNVPTHESARQALLGYFDSYGLETYRHNFTAGGLDQANILGIRWGAVRDQWVVVGGHYDTTTDDCLAGPLPGVGCPLRARSEGAYDDGSGTMMTVHLGKAFSQLDPYYTMVFVAYDGEERGTQGARAFVQDFVVNALDDNGTQKTPYGQVKVVGAVDLDMVGINWPGTMAPMNVLTNSEVAFKVADTKRHAMGWPDDQWVRKDGLTLGSSDYARFWEVTEENNGPIPTIFFISDFEELGLPAPLPPQAHTPTPLGVYPFWHLEDTVPTMTLMAGSEANLQAGFQATLDLAVDMLYAMACQPGLTFDAVPM